VFLHFHPINTFGLLEFWDWKSFPLWRCLQDLYRYRFFSSRYAKLRIMLRHDRRCSRYLLHLRVLYLKKMLNHIFKFTHQHAFDFRRTKEADGAAFDHQSLSLIKLNNSTILYLREVNRFLALVCILREDHFARQGNSFVLNTMVCYANIFVYCIRIDRLQLRLFPKRHSRSIWSPYATTAGKQQHKSKRRWFTPAPQQCRIEGMNSHFYFLSLSLIFCIN